MFSRSLCGAVISAGLGAVLFCSASGIALADAVGDEFSQIQAPAASSVDAAGGDQGLVLGAGGAETGGQPAGADASLVPAASGGDATTDDLDSNDETPATPTVTNGSGAADENSVTTGDETITGEGDSVPATPDATGADGAATGADGLATGAEGMGTGVSDALGGDAGAADPAEDADGSSTGDGAGATGSDEELGATPGSDGAGVEGVGENGAVSETPSVNPEDVTATDDQESDNPEGSDTPSTGFETTGSDGDAVISDGAGDGTGDNAGNNPDAAGPAEDAQGVDDQDAVPALDADADTTAAVAATTTSATSTTDAATAGTATAATTTSGKATDTATAAAATSTDADAATDTASAALAAPENGWSDMGDGTWYYYVDGVRVTGQRKIGGKWYYFDPLKDGAMARGFVNLGSKTCYYGDDGAMCYGQQKVDGSWYYLTPGTGAMRTGFVDLGSKTCYYDDQGRMQYGQRKVSGKWYYLRPGTGARAESAFVDLSSKTVYYGSDGAMRYGQQKIAGSWYLFASKTGAMQTGFVDVPGAGKTCYYDDQGRMQYGQRKVSGKWYYLRPGTGAMARDVLVTLTGNFKVFGEMVTSKNVYYCVDGSMIYGEVEVDGNWYYLEPKTGARAEDRFITHAAQQKTVYYDEWGVMARGGRMIGDRYYYFDETTGARKTAEDMAMWYPSSGMDAIAQGYWSGTENLILVDLDAHVTAVYEGSQGSWNQVRCMYCSVGAPETPTVTGVFEVGMRGYYFDSGYDRCFYFTQFYGDYLFHTILYAQTETPEYINDGTLGAHVSHGCVRMLLEDAYYINANIPSGTTVVVY